MQSAKGDTARSSTPKQSIGPVANEHSQVAGEAGPRLLAAQEIFQSLELLSSTALSHPGCRHRGRELVLSRLPRGARHLGVMHHAGVDVLLLVDHSL